MTASPLTQALCVCDGARVPAGIAAADWPQRVTVTTVGDEADLTFVIEHLAARFGHHLVARVQDLLAIAAYCFAVDREVRRTARIDVHRERWKRELVVCLPVVDPDFWTTPAVTTALNEALAFGTDDRWTFHFDRFIPGDAAPSQATIGWDDRMVYDEPDAVILFSGGTDSLCALVDAVAAQKRRPVLVSHWASELVKGRQERLRGAVRRRLGEWSFPHVPIELHRRGEGDGESSQRSRGFLFASLGAAVAAHLGVATVLLPENGYVSVNPRINDQLVGALASRGAHPKFLQLFNHFLELVFDGAVHVENPLWDKTRAEALRALRAADVPELLEQTYSCGKLQGRPPRKPHCGGCSQCIDRRFGALQAELEAHDPADRYAFDLFADALPEGEATTVALSYLRFAKALHDLDPETILDQRRELDQCVDPDDPDFGVRLWALADLLRRHASETLSVMGAQYARHGERLARHEIDAKSLLVRWQGSTDSVDGATAEREAAAPFGVPINANQSRFERLGSTWSIVFRDERGGLPNRAGARRLARILKAAHEGLESLDLVHGSSRAPRRSKEGSARDRRQSQQGDAGAMTDLNALTAYRKRKDELQNAINLHVSAERHTQAAELQDEVDWIDRELRACLGKGGEIRAFPEEHERARQTVSATVRGDLKELKADMPKLWSHFDAFLHLGYRCWYRPDPPESWDVTL